jgi:regulatory protein
MTRRQDPVHWSSDRVMPKTRRLEAGSPSRLTAGRSRLRAESSGEEPGPPGRSAYIEGLSLLARRELSEAQVRARLLRRQYSASEVDAAVARLKAERSIDDERVAGVIARAQTTLRRRGHLRVRREIEKAGIAGVAAREAVDAVFGELDEAVLLEAALKRRLRGGGPIADDREFRRLYRYLIAQGFESDLILRALHARRQSG